MEKKEWNGWVSPIVHLHPLFTLTVSPIRPQSTVLAAFLSLQQKYYALVKLESRIQFSSRLLCRLQNSQRLLQVLAEPWVSNNRRTERAPMHLRSRKRKVERLLYYTKYCRTWSWCKKLARARSRLFVSTCCEWFQIYSFHLTFDTGGKG